MTPIVKTYSGLNLSNGYNKKAGELTIFQKIYLFLKWRTGLVLTCFIITLLCTLKLFWYSSNTHTLSPELTPVIETGGSEAFYGIMLDAGSTGSRIHVYHFRKYDQTSPPILVEELFEQIKPGLSSYAENPKDGVASIEKLLLIAKKTVPQNLWSTTPLALKATAGLRLLPTEQADKLLTEVEALFQRYPFALKTNPVAIMDGVDEGQYGWITVNFLLERFGKGGSNQFTVGTIDLGGGSMQMTFAPHEKLTISNAPAGFVNDVSIFGGNLKVYSHSYLGLGLMSARESILTLSKTNMAVDTVCVPSGYKFEWKNAHKTYVVEGAAEGKNKIYDLCRQSARDVVSTKIIQPTEIKHQTFYVFSYFFDRAVDMNMIDEEEGGVLTVNRFIDAAQKACSKESFNKTKPFLCMDMCLLATFLEDGFGFAADTQLITRSTIAGKETSWTLGATFPLLNE